MNELPVPLTEKFSSGNEKIMFKHRDDVVVPKRVRVSCRVVSCAVVCRADLRVCVRVQEVVRVYFTDHTYKSFMVGPEDTVRSLIMQVAKKVQVAPHGHYLLEMTGDGTLSSRLPPKSPPCVSSCVSCRVVSCRAHTRVVCRPLTHSYCAV
jgi:hypothetical protein